MNLDYKNTIAIDVYIENRKTRSFVGRLEKKHSIYEFEYDDKYLREKTAVSLGPDIPLSRRKHQSRNLFESFLDRIPSSQNPAYPEYCARFGINTDEKNPFILLATIGSRGPSSFIFEPVFDEKTDSSLILEYRKELALSIRDFAAVFDLSPSSLSKIENGYSSGRDVLKRLEIYINFPQTALYEIEKNKGKIHGETYKRLKKYLAGKM